jgi:hypothetical protein
LAGYIIPLIIKDGLARIDIRPHIDHEFNSLVLDSDNIDQQHPDIDFLTNKSFKEYGHFRHRVNV